MRYSYLSTCVDRNRNGGVVDRTIKYGSTMGKSSNISSRVGQVPDNCWSVAPPHSYFVFRISHFAFTWKGRTPLEGTVTRAKALHTSVYRLPTNAFHGYAHPRSIRRKFFRRLFPAPATHVTPVQEIANSSIFCIINVTYARFDISTVSYTLAKLTRKGTENRGVSSRRRRSHGNLWSRANGQD